MKRLGYRAYDANGRLIQGEITSESRESALDELRRRGQFPLEVAPDLIPSDTPWWNRDIVLFRGMSSQNRALLTRELAVLVKADLPLDEVLRIAALQPSASSFTRRVTETVLERVMEGQSLSQALAGQPDAFPEYYWRMVSGGEASGKLSEVLDNLAAFLERSTEIRNKIISALIYPAILLVMAGATIITIMAVMLPAIVPILKDSGTPLPFVVWVLDSARTGISDNWGLILVSMVILAGLCVAAYASGAMKDVVSRLVLAIPVVAGLIRQKEVARFSRTMGTLLKSGVPLLDAARLSSGVLSNSSYRAAIMAAADDVREGASLSQPLRSSSYFPEVALRLIVVGEKTGQLENMLLRVADIFEASLQRQLDRITVLITPVLTLAIGLLVGGLIVSVMGALLSVNSLAIN